MPNLIPCFIGVFNNSLQNTNPSVGIIKKDGTQEIRVFDKEIGNTRDILTSKEKVDEFIKNRKEQKSKLNTKTFLYEAFAAMLGSGLMMSNSRIRRTLRHPALICVQGACIGALSGLLIGKTIKAKSLSNMDKNFINENIK